MTAQQTLSRRDFLKTAGVGAAAVTATCVLGSQASPASASGSISENGWAMLIDTTRCTGCQSCALACKEIKERPNPTVEPAALSNEAYTFIDLRPNPGSEKTINVKRQCMHCQHPACVSACTVGALRKTADGPVTYDDKKCIGCRYCQYACPFGVPTYDWNNPLGLIHKCDLCVQRLAEGEMPACVASCPAGALHFGRRSDMLAQARARIRSNQRRYVDKVYGEYEAGGTSMLYLAGVPFSQLGLPELGEQTISHQAEAVMVKTPVVAASVATLATGLYWLLKRRDLKLNEAQVTLPQEDQDGH